MASKKKPENSEPKISNIPMPISDNPLVVDLPDGQKLILGKLTPGHVIEVATWRGTGRPDSRTNRLMLGMTDGSEPEAKSENGEDTSSAKTTNRKIKLPFKVKVPTGKLANSFKFVFTNVSKALARTRELKPIDTTAELNIDAWIESISKEAEAKSQLISKRAAHSPDATVKKKPATKKATKKSPPKRK
jgi:hypothetical protein